MTRSCWRVDRNSRVISGTGTRAKGHPLCDGVPAATESAVRRRYGSGCVGDHGDGQARGDHRRWRYGRRLPGTSHRQKALSIHQFEIMPMPPQDRAAQTPWPLWPMQLRVESSHEEGGVRDWSIATQKFTGDEQGNVKQLHGIRVGAPPKFEPMRGLSSRWTLTWCCWRWDSRVRFATACSNNSACWSIREGTWRQTISTPHLFRACSLRAICAADSRWWYGLLLRVARPPQVSTLI